MTSHSEAAAALLFFSGYATRHWAATESAAIIATKLNPNVALCFAAALPARPAGARRLPARLALWRCSVGNPHGRGPVREKSGPSLALPKEAYQQPCLGYGPALLAVCC